MFVFSLAAGCKQLREQIRNIKLIKGALDLKFSYPGKEIWNYFDYLEETMGYVLLITGGVFSWQI